MSSRWLRAASAKTHYHFLKKHGRKAIRLTLLGFGTLQEAALLNMQLQWRECNCSGEIFDDTGACCYRVHSNLR